jgi:hypothetical protein
MMSLYSLEEKQNLKAILSPTLNSKSSLPAERFGMTDEEDFDFVQDDG